MDYNDLDFIEIGTSNFDTLIERATDETRGLSIEPIKHYLDQLPDKKNIKKINCAVAIDNSERLIDIYYVPEHLIKLHNLPSGTVGCNSINGYHPLHKRLNIEHLVSIAQVQQLPIEKVLVDNNVRKINHLKIDTEGGDCDILLHLHKYLENKEQEYYPKKITFESNYLTDDKKIKFTINEYVKFGYSVYKSNRKNTILTKQ